MWSGSAGLVRHPVPLFVMLVLAAGMALRLAYPDDIEYKADERWSFEQARSMADGGPWPRLGMPMSVGGRNPGLSVWVFGGLAWVSRARTPPELARAVQVTNSLALLALLLFTWQSVPRSSREAWLWGVALWAANPAAVIFERKIWPPSVLPLLTIGLIAAWWHRRHSVASFLLAVIAALMAQIHPLAALLPVALVLWGLAEDSRSIRWGAFLAGGLLGALSALPWLSSLTEGNGIQAHWPALPVLHFYRRWAFQPFGFSAHYTLGTANIFTVLGWPMAGGTPTYLLALAHAALASVMLLLWVRAIAAIRAWQPRIRPLVFGDDQTGWLMRATFWGYGGLLSLITVFGAGAERHYLIVIAPIMAVWVARLAAFPTDGRFTATARALLAVCCAGQLLVSGLLLDYIHHAGVIDAEYGPTWAAQQKGLAPSPRSIDVPPE
jgi:hypothetical protein